jgi:hypothetical protein
MRSTRQRTVVPQVGPEFVVDFLAGFADAAEDFNRALETLDCVVVNRQRDAIGAAGSFFASIAMTQPNKQRARQCEAYRTARTSALKSLHRTVLP